MWAISKSPLVIGAPANASITSEESLAILSNKDVVALNQDLLGEQAQLIRRYTEEEYDIFAGNLSESRKVIGVANWSNSSKSVNIDLQLVGVQKSGNIRDVWAAKDLGQYEGAVKVDLKGHEAKLLILSDLKPAGALTGKPGKEGGITFENVYGITTSGNYTLLVTSPSSKRRTVILHSGEKSVSQTMSSANYAISSIPLQRGQNNLTLTDPESRPVSAQLIYDVEPLYYPAATGILQGDAMSASCGGGCLPKGSKVTNMTVGSSVTFSNVSGGVLGGMKLIGIDYINYDVALASAWTNGTNTRNFTLSVNGGEPRRWSFPISGGDWYETGRLDVLLEGFHVGSVNELRVEAPGLDPGADLVGLAVYT